MRVGFFSYAIFAAYLAFVPPETASKAILAVRDRVKLSRLVPDRAFRRGRAGSRWATQAAAAERSS